MIYREEYKDLFEVDGEYYFAQCISADFAMGKGIAVNFNKRYDVKNKIMNLFPEGFVDDTGCYEPVGCVLVDNVLNLVTKRRHYDKPTYHTMEGALYFMREICEENGIKKIAMPTIGCGLDKLEWRRVRKIIQDIFEASDVEILICVR